MILVYNAQLSPNIQIMHNDLTHLSCYTHASAQFVHMHARIKFERLTMI